MYLYTINLNNEIIDRIVNTFRSTNCNFYIISCFYHVCMTDSPAPTFLGGGGGGWWMSVLQLELTSTDPVNVHFRPDIYMHFIKLYDLLSKNSKGII